MSHPSTERVLVVPSAEFDRLGRFQGYHPQAGPYLSALLVPGSMSYRPRSEVEEDPGYKQIIPYVVLRCGGEVFCYTRGGGQGEGRLRRKRSLGVGGHVSEADAAGALGLDAYEMATRRELEEEVEVGSPGRMRLVGLINDDSTPVGRVHLGVVHVLDLDSPQVAPREDGLERTGFVPIRDLGTLRDEFETWSQICIDGFLSPGG